jgi:Glycosyl transferase family 90
MTVDDMKLSYQMSVIDSILQFINKQSEFISQQKNYSLKTINPKEYYDSLYRVGRSNPIHTSDHDDPTTPKHWQPEALYVVDGDFGDEQQQGRITILTSQYTKDIANSDGYAIQFKYTPTERLMKEGLKMLRNEEHDDDLAKAIPTRWPKLHQLLVVEKGSFPFLAHYSDYIGCNFHNWNEHKESIPLFTVAANVKCNHTFPFPSYSINNGMKNTSDEWYHKMHNWRNQYGSWNDKTSKVVWRGSLTGKMPEAIEHRGPRWHLTKLVHDDTRLTPEQINLFDIKLTSLTEYSQHEWIKPNELGGVNESYRMSMVDYQNYKAILDIDGHSWSSRYSTLLCYSSVILKVEPNYVDYFYYPKYMKDDPYTLRPWKHFIPIKYDMTDLVDKAAYVMDPMNANQIKEIIHNANEWCANRNILPSVGKDVLDIWEDYVNILGQSSELKMLVHSDDLMDNRLDGSHTRKILKKLESYENHVTWKNQWNAMKGNVYDGVLEMNPI